MASGTISLPDDTGWIDATLGSNFNLYDDGGYIYGCKYRRVGNFVSIAGVVTPKSNLTISSVSDLYTITTLPVGFRPALTVRSICQGATQHVWHLDVTTDGDVRLSRYRMTNSSSYSNCPSGAWLPFSIVFEV